MNHCSQRTSALRGLRSRDESCVNGEIIANRLVVLSVKEGQIRGLTRDFANFKITPSKQIMIFHSISTVS